MASSWSKTEAGRKLPDRVLVGLVLRPHGVRGAVVVEAHSDTPGRLDAGSEPRTLEEIGQDLSVTRERVRQIEAAAFQKLRELEEGQTLREFLTVA